MHIRIENAIKKAPVEEQIKVWDAFNADQDFGEIRTKMGGLVEMLEAKGIPR